MSGGAQTIFGISIDALTEPHSCFFPILLGKKSMLPGKYNLGKRTSHEEFWHSS